MILLLRLNILERTSSPGICDTWVDAHTLETVVEELQHPYRSNVYQETSYESYMEMLNDYQYRR